MEAAGGLLLFNKSAVLLPIAALVAGLSIRYSPRIVLPVGLLVIVSLFLSIGGSTSYGRIALGPGAGGGIEARGNVLIESLSDASKNAGSAEYQPWARFCYVPSQNAALDFYDQGRGGDDFRLIPWLFVPRALAPDKPVITQSAYDFNTKITGFEGSSTGQGVFASGYYNGGWLGALVASVLCGWLLAQTSAIAQAIFQRRALLLLPIALLGVYMAFRIDGHFVADYMGAFVFILYPLLGAALVLGLRGPAVISRLR
jgi:hypothetical protein